ncbi:MAG: tRNA lysidine(34) synthetase TilS, partial [Acidimicrobiia bacterium]|nr:tRNA lysidine(34) synthetase TilS [Acidimicrobiia bacterium]
MAVTGRLKRLLDDAVAGVPAGPLVVALSGGADSAVAARVAADRGGEVRAVHVHHGLPDSDQMELAAKAVAASFDIEFESIHVEVPAGPSPEAQARSVRRAALESTAGPQDWIVTGHQRDDVAETVLDRLGRGSGSTGLAALRPVDGRWVRPLLAMSRDDVRMIAEALGLPYDDDPSNADLGHRRNRIRSIAGPVLEDVLGSEAFAGLARSARLLGADDAALEAAAASIEARSSLGEWYLSAAEVTVADPAVAARAIRRILRVVHGGLPGDAGEVDAVRSAASGNADRLDLSGAWSVVREGPWVVITTTPVLAVPEPVRLETPGVTRFGPYRIDARRDTARPIGRSGIVLPAELVESGIEVRAAVDGERIDIGNGSKKVSDAMGECGLP